MEILVNSSIFRKDLSFTIPLRLFFTDFEKNSFWQNIELLYRQAFIFVSHILFFMTAFGLFLPYVFL